MAKHPYEAAKNNILLAPLAGITDRAFRELCIEQGAGMAFTEMVSAKGLLYENIHTRELLETGPAEGKVGVQLFGREPEILADMAARLEQEHGQRIAVFDLNMGCPAPKIVNNGEGCALMKEPALAGKIIAAVKKRVKLPVTVKFRKGFEKERVNCVEFAKIAEDNGADAITVHGRTRDQFYEGTADWEAIRQVKQAVHIYVNANGDIFTPEDAKSILEYTGADGAMVARGALGNPFLFGQILSYLQTGTYTVPTEEEKIRMAIRQAELAVEYKGERVAIREMRKHAAWYTKGMRHGAKWRNMLVKAETLAQLRRIFGDLLESLEKKDIF